MLQDLVRWKGFEPSRYCYRQPLKLVRLPVPPPPQSYCKFDCIARRLRQRRFFDYSPALAANATQTPAAFALQAGNCVTALETALEKPELGSVAKAQAKFATRPAAFPLGRLASPQACSRASKSCK
jgi:hypothetical protein